MLNTYTISSDELSADTGYWQSTTFPLKAVSSDKYYYYLPYWDTKQCMHVRSIWPDHRRRMYNSNLISCIIDMFVSYFFLIFSCYFIYTACTDFQVDIVS